MTDVEQYTVKDLLYLMSRLRDPENGCPWDTRQTFLSITPFTIEEVYEVVDAIERKDFDQLKEELGDLLFQVVFYSQLGHEQKHFSFSEVVSDLVGKLIRRHPHVFPDGILTSICETDQIEQDKVKSTWENLKQVERSNKGNHGVLDDIPLALPSLMRAQKLQKRASSVGFDWTELNGVIEKLEEEITELKEAIQLKDESALADEMGDILFAAVNISRHLNLNAESTLRAGNNKFERRFRYVESKVKEDGQVFEDFTLQQLDDFWDEAKKQGL